MQEYTFKYGPFYFKVQGQEDKEAVSKARRALEDSITDDALDHLQVKLKAGAFSGRLYIEPLELSTANICQRERLPDVLDEPDAPF